MDEELIFGIGYDFEKGLREAEKEAEAATARLERILSRRPVGVSVSTLGVETFADKTGKTIKELQEQLDKLSAKWRDMPLDRMWTGDGAMRQLTDEARELWDELYTVTTVLHSMGRDAQTMANESIREIEKEEAALEKLEEQQEAARRKAEERRKAQHDRVARGGLQKAWNDAADNHESERRENELLWGQAETVKEITDKVGALQRKLTELAPGNGQYEALTGEFVKWSGRLREVREEAERYIATARGFADVSRTIEVTRETMGGLSARLAEYRQSMESMEVGSDEWNKTALCIRQVSTALEAATQWAKDFSAAAFKGLGEKMTTSRVEELQLLRQEMEQVEEKWNRLRASNDGMGNGDGGEQARAEEMNTLMERRIELQNEINVRLRSMADAQADYEKAQAAAAAKTAADDARLQALTLEETSIENITRKLEAWRQEMNGAAIGGREWEEAAKEVWRLSEALDEARRQGEALKGVNTNILSGLTEQLGRLEGLMGRTDTGSDEWKRMAAAAAMLRDNIAQIQEHMSDFGQASWKGLEPEAVQAKTAALQSLREQIREVDEAFNRQMQGDVPVDDDAAAERAERVNSLLEERLRLQNEINKLTETAGQAAARLEKAQAAAAEQARREAERERIALYGEEQTIDGLTKKLAAWQEKLRSASIGGHAFNDAVEQVKRLSEALEKAKRRVEILTGTARGVRGACPAVREVSDEIENAGRRAERTEGRLGRMGTAIRDGMRGLASNLQTVNAAWDRQHGLVERIIRRMAVYASMSAMGRFLQSVREVTAEFELQRVSLGAIIRDQEQADSLFKEIKGFALKSPLKIMDLTRYTKQVAAYGIETEKLFDTTKRLADVSVGLGVDMGRIVLAYGQVKAASYLRAAEVRQFTEAGIPMLELLAKKLTGMNGELVTTADVMDMISKRGVGFEMVEKIFEDLTSKGGMFYNMQEKQGNTLYGMWSKLGDAASMMYDEIGNTSAVNGAMKDLIGLLSTLMQHWRGVAGAMATGGLLWGVKGLHSMGGKIKDAAGKQYEAAVTARIEAEART